MTCGRSWQSQALALNHSSAARYAFGRSHRRFGLNPSTTLLCFVVSCSCAQASITFNISVGDLKTLNGTQPMPISGQILLVASTNDASFGLPTPEYFATGNDVVLYRGDLDSGFGPGIFERAVNLSLGSFPGMKPGDPVQLYWFPTLTAGSTRPGEGTMYGLYRHDTGLDGSAPWVIPGDGSLVDLKFLTVSEGGSNSDALGHASRTITRPVILSLAGAGTTNVVITWSAVSNLVYRVRYRPDFNSAWINLGPDVTATNNTASTADNSGGAPQRFYQVVLVQ